MLRALPGTPVMKQPPGQGSRWAGKYFDDAGTSARPITIASVWQCPPWSPTGLHAVDIGDRVLLERPRDDQWPSPAVTGQVPAPRAPAAPAHRAIRYPTSMRGRAARMPAIRSAPSPNPANA